MGLWTHSVCPASPPLATLHRGRGTGGSPETRPLHSLPLGSLSHEQAWLPNARLSLNPVTKRSSADWVPGPSMTTLSSKERSLGEAGQRQEEMGQGPGREKREPAFKERGGHTALEDSPTRGGELPIPGQGRAHVAGPALGYGLWGLDEAGPAGRKRRVELVRKI